MKNVVLSCFCQGSAKKKGLGWAKKIGAMALGLLCLMAPLSVKAQAITQLEYLQWLVQLAGEASLLPQNATAADYVAWARSRNVEPAGGWQPGAAMTQASYAQTLGQLYGINISNPNANSWVRALEREGVVVPSEITRIALVTSLDRAGFAQRQTTSPTKGNNGVGNGEDPQPPGNPPINDGPGTGPGHPGNKGGKPGKGNGNANGNH